MFAILSASFWLIMSKMIPIKNGGCSFSYIRIWGKLEESRHEKGDFFLHMPKQRRSNPKADQRLCFRNTVWTIHLLPKFEISSFIPSSVAEQPGLCWTWLETPKTVFPWQGSIVVKLEFTGVHSFHFFLNHRLWVIVRTVTLRRYWGGSHAYPCSMIWAKISDKSVCFICKLSYLQLWK